MMYYKCQVIVLDTPDVKEDDSPSLSTGGAVAITLVLSILVSLPVGVMIGARKF